jgi:membrane-associated phospholipid phosphatase
MHWLAGTSVAYQIATTVPPQGESGRALRGDQSIGVPLATTGTLLAVWLGLELFVPKPSVCSWCRAPAFDIATRKALRLGEPSKADVVSNVLALGILPAATLASTWMAGARESSGRQLGPNLLYVAEAVALSGLVNEVTKLLLARQRPYASEAPDEARKGSDQNMSFYSGHTSYAFSLATAAGTVASLRGYRLAPLVWSTGLPLAALVGVFRILADKHYLSDVLVGALVGAGIGIALPTLLHNRQEPGR